MHLVSAPETCRGVCATSVLTLFLGICAMYGCNEKQAAPEANARITASSPATEGDATRAQDVSRTSKPATAPQPQAPPKSDQGVTAAEETDRCRQGDDASCVASADRIRRDAGSTLPALQHALLLYQSACDRRVADGCAGLGAMLQDGLGTAQNLPRAQALYRQSCDAKSGRGCSRLGVLYVTGRGVARDPAQASGFLQAGCEFGDGLGCMNLGIMYQRGDGVPMDVARARELYTKACLFREGGGCRQLGELYASGFTGQAPNPKLSSMFAEKACALDDAVGCSNTGMNYQVGFGTTQDPAKAARMYRKACELGERRACDLIERLTPPSTPTPQ